MAGHQHIVVVGYLGRDPELKYTANGIAVCHFSIAVSNKYQKQNGEAAEETIWHNCTAWRRLAEIAHQYAAKGSLVMVVGQAKARGYYGRDGEPAGSLDVTVSTLRLLSSSREHQREDDAFPPEEEMDIPF